MVVKDDDSVILLNVSNPYNISELDYFSNASSITGADGIRISNNFGNNFINY